MTTQDFSSFKESLTLDFAVGARLSSAVHFLSLFLPKNYSGKAANAKAGLFAYVQAIIYASTVSNKSQQNELQGLLPEAKDHLIYLCNLTA